jgi:peptidyl-prolyl cis-trans isomerase A (cyclophilin A)
LIGARYFRMVWILLMLAAIDPWLAAAQKTRAGSSGLYAVIDTAMGRIVCELYEKKTPRTAANFVGLAEGTKEWLSPKGEMVKRPYYNGVIFHRVIKNFMIQAGDITGTGTFKPILPFGDEIVAGLRFDRPGMLAMANSGPNTNGTQFFITVAPTPHLNGKHTIFGEVVEGLDVAVKISKVSVGPAYRPWENVVINKILIERRDKIR